MEVPRCIVDLASRGLRVLRCASEVLTDVTRAPPLNQHHNITTLSRDFESILSTALQADGQSHGISHELGVCITYVVQQIDQLEEILGHVCSDGKVQLSLSADNSHTQKAAEASDVVRELATSLRKFSCVSNPDNRAEQSLQRLLTKPWPKEEAMRMQNIQNTLLKRRTVHTGGWLSQSSQFRDWTNGKIPVLWLNGPTGCGKTMLTAYIIQSVGARLATNDNFGFGFVYFNDLGGRRCSYLDYLRSLIEQLSSEGKLSLSQRNSYWPTTCKSPGKLEEMLATVVEQKSRVFLVLDALDGSQDERHVLESLAKIRGKFKKVSIFISSQRSVGIEHHMKGWHAVEIGAQNEQDIAKFTGVRLSDLRIQSEQHIAKFKPSNLELQQYIDACIPQLQYDVCFKADGNFLFASLAVDQTLRYSAEHLASPCLPDTLSELVQCILNKTDALYKDAANAVWQWLACSKTLPTVGLLVQAIQTRDSSPNVGGPRTRFVKDTLFLLQPLIVIENSTVPSMGFPDLFDDQANVQFAHNCIKSHVLSHVHIVEYQSHHAIAQDCIRCILSYKHQLQRNQLNPNSAQADLEKCPLLKYAAQNWFMHQREAEQSWIGTFPTGLEMLLLTLPEYLETWLSLFRQDGTLDRPPFMVASSTTPPSALYCASYLGLDHTVNVLLGKGVDVNEIGGTYGNAFQVAIHQRHEKIAWKLFCAGAANLRMQAGAYGNPLQAASHVGDSPTVLRLMQHGADVGAAGGFYGYALQAAASAGHTDVVGHLIARGADVNAQGGLHGTALQAASVSGYAETVELLLGSGADPNTEGGLHGSALQAATAGGHTAVMQMLFSAGALSEPWKAWAEPCCNWRVERRLTSPLESKGDASLKTFSHAGFGKHDLLIPAKDSIKLSESFNVESTYRQKLENLERLPSISIYEGHSEDDLRPAKSHLWKSSAAVRDALLQDANGLAEDELIWVSEMRQMGYDLDEIASAIFERQESSPWIYYEPETITSGTPEGGVHVYGCAHFSQSLHDDSSSDGVDRLPTKKPECSPEMRDRVWALCGLAGVAPTARTSASWTRGILLEGERTASITYMPDVSLWHHPHSALEKFCSLTAELQQSGQLCDSFTVLKTAYPQDTSNHVVAELCAIPLQYATDLLHDLRLILRSPSIQYRRDAFRRAKQVVDIISPLNGGDSPIYEDWGDHGICALAVQIFCIGFVSYMHAHSGILRPFFLEHGLEEVHLMGAMPIGGSGLHVVLKQLDLTCMGKMLLERVLVFECSSELGTLSDHQLPQCLDLLACADDLVDTWGPAEYLRASEHLHPDLITAILIGGGVLGAASETSDSYHWFRDIRQVRIAINYKKSLHRQLKVLIGATIIKVNEACDFSKTTEEQKSLWCGRFLDPLGTYEDYWEMAEVQFGLQAGQFGILTSNVTMNKRQGRNLKEVEMLRDDSDMIPFLDSTWGLQVSFCSSIARRVKMRRLIADLLPVVVERKVPTFESWPNLRDTHKIMETLRADDDLTSWIADLSTKDLPSFELLCKLIRSIMTLLRDTGVDPQGGRFVIAWVPSKPVIPLQCLKVHANTSSFWTRILKDSADCVTFAYFTADCLQIDDWGCRNAERSWYNRVLMMETEVHRHIDEKDGSEEASTEPWVMKDSEIYPIGRAEGRSGLQLRAKVKCSTYGQTPYLVVTQNKTPILYVHRLGRRWRTERLRERLSCVDDLRRVLVVSDESLTARASNSRAFFLKGHEQRVTAIAGTPPMST